MPIINVLIKKVPQLRIKKWVLVFTSAVQVLATGVLIHFLRNSNLDWGASADINKKSGMLVILEEIFLLAGVAFKLTFNNKMALVFSSGWKR
ncbi:MAG: hypothetical protein K6T65_16555 [Peptococcaceae bacterium]|nr:hypothetical protein [Peptococcaceae bacterium]